MSSIDQQFVEYIVKSLVGDPDAVQIERRIDEKGVLLELTVDPEDLGRIIGKRGATAQSLRTLLRALGTKNDARYNLKIIDNGPQDYANRPSENNGPQDGAADDQTSQATTTDDQEATQDDDNEAEEPRDTPAPAAAAPKEEPTPPVRVEDPTSIASKTRRELEDLDDLDI